ncbi:MAG: PEP-CTERM sorting domain-containing protein, partial [Planctomycetota bacterium]
NWGQAVNPPGWAAVDQRQGVVSQGELDNVLLNWGDTASPNLSGLSSGSASVVPEPGSLVLALAGSMALLGVRLRSPRHPRV